jgi:cytochrome c
MKAYSMIAIVLVVSSGLACAQDLAAGGAQFKKCAPCHDVGETAKNKIGPVLNGIERRKSGTVPGFKYSEANKGSGIVWDETQFLDYIKDPKVKIPGTIMVFVGLKNEEDTKNLWTYLKQFDRRRQKEVTRKKEKIEVTTVTYLATRQLPPRNQVGVAKVSPASQSVQDANMARLRTDAGCRPAG